MKSLKILALLILTAFQVTLVSAIHSPAHADWWSQPNNLPKGCSKAIGHNFGPDYVGAAQESITNLYCVPPGSLFPSMLYDTKGNPSLFSICAKNPNPGLPPYFCGDATNDCTNQQISTLNGCTNNVPYTCDPCAKAASGQQGVGDPIDVSSGNKREVVTDFTTAGPDSLTLTRYYNSNTSYNGAYERSTTMGPFYGRFGYGWRSEYDGYVASDAVPGSATFLNLVRADGESVHFIRSSGIWYVAYWNPATLSWSPSTDPRHDIDITLVEDVPNAHWIVTDAADIVETYDSTSTGPAGIYVGKMLTRKYRDGYLQTFGYDSSGNNTTIDDSLGRHVSFTYAAGGFVDTFTDTAGTVTHYYYVDRSCLSPPCSWSPPASTDFALWALQTVTYPDAKSVTYEYEDTRTQDRFALTGITDELTNRFATWAYDDQGRAVSSQLAGGANLTTISYDDVGNTRTVTNALTKQTIYDLSAFQGQLAIQSVNGQASAHTPASTVSYLYDTNGFVKQMTSGEGRVITYIHNSIGEETSRTEGDGTPEARTITTHWNATYHVPSEIVEPNLTTDFSYPAGLLTQLTETDTTTQSIPYSTNGQTRTWQFGYYPTGLLHTVDGPLAGTADTTTYVYNANGFVSSVTDPLGHMTTISQWNGFGQPLVSTDPNGIATNYTYDARDRLRTVIVNPGSSQAVYDFQYDDAGEIHIVTLPNGASLTLGYDNAHRLKTIAGNTGGLITYTLDALGDRKKTTIKNGSTLVKTQTASFDELGRMLNEIGAASQETQYTYDKDNNQVTVQDPRSKLYGYAFDALNRLYQETDPDLFQTITGYNGKDEVTSVTDARTLVTSYVRDGFGDAIQVTSPDTGTTVLWYDADGNATKRVDARGVETDFTYDVEERLKTRKIHGTTAENVTFTYDVLNSSTYGIGRLRKIADPTGSTTFNYDPLGHVTQESRIIQGNTYNIGFADDPSGHPQQITYPSGRIVTYMRDTMGRISGITTQQNSTSTAVTVASAASYLPFGPLGGFTYGNGVVLTVSHDQDYQVSGITAATGTTNIQNLTYSPDPAGNILTITDNLIPLRSQSFTYDDLNRIKSATGIYGQQTYLYDGTGNRTRRTLTSVPDVYAIDPTSNRITTVTTGSNVRSFTYLPTGQVQTDTRDPTHAYVYNYNNIGRLSSATLNGATVGTYLVNGEEQRVVKTIGSATTHYIFDRLGHLLAEANGTTGAIQREYIWLDDLPVALVDETGSSPVLYYIHTDHLGTPQRITDGSSNIVWNGAFDPFGNPNSIIGSLTNNLRFPGQYFDAETGLHQNWNRDYDPSIGRYVESDPIGLLGGTNTYSYSESNPITASDFLGLVRKLDPNSQECKDLLQKIKNIENDIASRKLDIATNPGGLPYLPPYPGAPRKLSVQGHEEIVQEYEQNLKRRKEEYENKCGCGGGGGGSPVPVLGPAPSPFVSPSVAPEVIPIIEDILEVLGAAALA